jgi:hypothetical protein
MKKFALGILFTLLVLIAGGSAYLLLGFAEVRGDLLPSSLESAFVKRAVHALGAARSARNGEPLPAD